MNLTANWSEEHWQRTQSLFHEAVAVAESERDALLEARCEGDTALMAELRSLLQACEAEEMHRVHLSLHVPANGRASTLVGPYELDRLLGRGGMGAVYLAHRRDGQFDQQVAVKLIDLPMDTEFFRERFRQERQILALLTHPFIARLLGGGVSESGELYLALEYVEGVSITQYCAENRLSVQSRVQLFLKVCDAVQYAHQNLVIHRDLKPENILIAADGTPRLLDFGTAKMIQPLSTAGGDLTRSGLQTFTPRYASPEQVLGQPISIASDIYSLGVLLYLLLVDAPPYELTEFSTEEMVKIICHQQPAKPSSASSSVGRLDGDLDAIVLMALRKEPQERYSTVEKFSADLQAWLEQRPVQARKGNVRYRAERFIRRNVAALAGVAVLAATGAAGVAGIAWQAHVARGERNKAQAQSEDLRQLSMSLLTELDDAIKQLPGSTNAQKLLVTRVLEHLDRASTDGTPDQATALNLADAFTRVGNLEGNPYDQNIGDTAGGLISVTKAVKLTEHWMALRPSDPDVLHAFAFAKQSQSEILFGTRGGTAEAVEAMKSAVSAYVTLASRADATPQQMSDASSAYGALGDELSKQGRGTSEDFAGGVGAYRKALEYQKKALGLNPAWKRALRTIPITMSHVGDMELVTDPWDAVRQFQASLAAMDHYPAEEKGGFTYKRTHSYILRRLGLALNEVQQYAQAITAMESAQAATEADVKADRHDMRSRADLVVALENKAIVYESVAADHDHASERVQNRLVAEGLLERLVRTLQEITSKTPEDVSSRQTLARAQVRLGTVQQGTPRSRSGAQLAAQGLSTLEEFGTQAHSSYLDNLLALSLLTVEPVSLRRPALAVEYGQRAVAQSPQQPEYWCNLAQAYRVAGAPDVVRRSAAMKGLALLMPVRPGESRSSTRKQLEADAQ